MDLAGRTVLVTGANRGIGRAFLDEALARGAALVYGAVRTPAMLDPAVAEYGNRVRPVRFDLADPTTVTDLAERCPGVDLLIANAAVGLSGSALDTPDADLRAVFEANLFAPLDLMRSFVPGLVDRRGGVLLVSSIAALLLSRSAPLYSASKAAVSMAFMGIRAQLRESGIRVGIVYPGFVDTDMTRAMTAPKATAASVARRSLDGFAAGQDAIFPDRYAEIVAAGLQRDLLLALSDPKAFADAAVATLQAEVDGTDA
jgi:NAD(P)-dependent dehydrogenase (short-subunit alcohol dehydrogenase family)